MSAHKKLCLRCFVPLKNWAHNYCLPCMVGGEPISQTAFQNRLDSRKQFSLGRVLRASRAVNTKDDSFKAPSIIKVCEQVQLDMEDIATLVVSPKATLRIRPGTGREQLEGVTHSRRKLRLLSYLLTKQNNRCHYCEAPLKDHVSLDAVWPTGIKHSGGCSQIILFYRMLSLYKGVVACCTRCQRYKGFAEMNGMTYFRQLARGYLQPFLPMPRKGITARQAFERYSMLAHKVIRPVDPAQLVEGMRYLRTSALRISSSCFHIYNRVHMIWNAEANNLRFECADCMDLKSGDVSTQLHRTDERVARLRSTRKFHQERARTTGSGLKLPVDEGMG